MLLDTLDGTPPEVEKALMHKAFAAAGKRVPSHLIVFIGLGETATAQVPGGPVVYLGGGRDAVAD